MALIYGVAILAGCLLAGAVAGEFVGYLLGIDANVGGVGIAMLLLLFVTSRTEGMFSLAETTRPGIGFWNQMYIPIVIAMAAKQNVVGAFQSGWIAILAGTLAVGASFLLIPWLSRLADGGDQA